MIRGRGNAKRLPTVLPLTATLMGSASWISVSADTFPPLIGPSPNGSAPEDPSTLNPITYWLVGIGIAAAILYGAYRAQKRHTAR